ncbi:MAG: UPF0254 family protein [Methanospirillum sp.]|uniref:UPF0254 family protein n=1 Tax=Methanospirillum sp. TaxID=45200 RepID=UPI00236F0546|nr:UPF0254 family protein [Methanospirillum sp.]MDD1727690.1 UPF0254 family protein [Methanospirillum sp.]
MMKTQLIKIATAECFTHGIVAREIHAFARGYPLNHPWQVNSEHYHLSLTAGMFIPTLSGVRDLLMIDPLPPVESPDDIKIYDQEQDLAMAIKMATEVRRITGAQIGIGTSAGIGTGCIALVSDGITITDTTEIHADLRTSNPSKIMERQKSGVSHALLLLELALQKYY